LLFNTLDTLAQYEEEAKLKASPTSISAQDKSNPSSLSLSNANVVFGSETDRPFLLQPFLIKNRLGTKIIVFTAENPDVWFIALSLNRSYSSLIFHFFSFHLKTTHKHVLYHYLQKPIEIDNNREKPLVVKEGKFGNIFDQVNAYIFFTFLLLLLLLLLLLIFDTNTFTR
jgi:hypothetical protein